jgi:hypothetical protein
LRKVPHNLTAAHKIGSVCVVAHARKFGCEVIVSKRKGSHYTPGRSLKTNNPEGSAARRLEGGVRLRLLSQARLTLFSNAHVRTGIELLAMKPSGSLVRKHKGEMVLTSKFRS